MVITSAEGIITISGLDDNELCEVYSLQGAKLSKSTAVNGFAQLNAMGERIVVVRIGSQNLKMVVN